jgi:hypothetical protein
MGLRICFSVVAISTCLGRPLALARDAVMVPGDDKENSWHHMEQHNQRQQSSSPVTLDTASDDNIMRDDDDHHHHHHHNDDSKNNTFCTGMYMTVFMDGFRWSLGAKDSSHTHGNSTALPPCLAYFVRSWKLSVSGKFRGAMLFSFLMALLTEGLAASRFVLIDWLRYPVLQRHRKAALTAVYALQSWLGTLIMLVAMMYSIEMLLSVIAGLMLGNFLFVRDHKNNNRGTTTRTGPTAFVFGPHAIDHAEEERLLPRPDDADSTGGQDSVGGLGSIGGLQMSTRKEE